MSGIEIAGLALGVLPVLISAIESYNDSLDPIKSFVRWERELPYYIRKLRNEHVQYALTIRQLLEPITTEFELAEMLAEPSGKVWKDPCMAGRLEKRLQESYLAYQSTISEVERIAKRIAGKLDLDRASELTRNDLEAIIAANPQKGNNRIDFRKRVRFGMSKKTIKGLLDELGECNKELERFTDKSEKLGTIRKSIKPSFASRFHRIQSLAKDLHSSILSSWSCTCRSSHNTSLQLEQRAALYTGAKKAISETKTCFTVSFSTSGDNTLPWRVQEAEIQIEEGGDADGEESRGIPATSPKRSKTVLFADEPPAPDSVLNTVAKSAMQRPTLQEVKDLCASIQGMHKNSPCIGLSLNRKTNLLRGVYAVHARQDQSFRAGEWISLHELLGQPPPINGRPMRLSMKERYALSVNIASSALQLNATPWFPDQWTAKDIVFHKTALGPRLVNTEHPYVTAKLVGRSNGSATAVTSKRQGLQNKNTVLLALAVALLELYFGTSAEQRHALVEASGKTPFEQNPWQLCALAYEWADSEQENMSAAFAGAVTHCLRCFSDPGASQQDPEFLQAAVESIVLPLQDELDQFMGKAFKPWN